MDEQGCRDIVQHLKHGFQAFAGQGCPLCPRESPTPPWVMTGWRDVVRGLGLCRALQAEWAVLVMGGSVWVRKGRGRSGIAQGDVLFLQRGVSCEE